MWFGVLVFLRSCLNLYRQVFYRSRIGCLFIFLGSIAGYVTAKKKDKQTFLNIKNGETPRDYIRKIFFRNLNSFLRLQHLCCSACYEFVLKMSSDYEK